MSPIFKVSYVVVGNDHPGAIMNVESRPEVGERVKLGGRPYLVKEVFDLIPTRGEFHYVHATVTPAGR